MENHRVVSEEEGKNLSKLYNMQYFETSAKDDTGVNEAFDSMSTNILSSLMISPDYLSLSKESLILEGKKKNASKKKSKCC